MTWLAVQAAVAAPLPRDVPLPPQRPAGLDREEAQAPARDIQGPPAPALSKAPADAAAPPPVPPDPAQVAACDRLLAGGKVRAERQPPIAEPEGCGVAAPIRLAAILRPQGGSIALVPPVIVGCTFADGFADWVRDDLAPLLASRGGGLASLSGTNGYACRGRNGVAGAKLSEHAAGNAVDIRAFVLADHSVADITKTARDDILFAQVKLTACARFSTVLGPGSDGYHENNLHLDSEYRRNGAHYCHWQLP